MRKVLALMVVLGLLVAFGVALDVQFASAEPDQGESTADCLVCHKGSPTDPATGNATKKYMTFHDSQVGECLTCHAVDNESIHGEWNDTPESCARCHRVHSAVDEGLLTMGKDALCEFCHGRAAGLAQTNVLDGVLRMSGEPLRGGGFEQAKMNTSASGNLSKVGYATNTSWSNTTTLEWKFPVGNATASGNVTSTHSLDVEGVIWGSGAISSTPKAGALTTLECVSCHDPHIYGLTYRMLKRGPTGAGNNTVVTDQLTFNKWAGNTTILSYTTSDYSNTLIYNKTWNGGNWTLTPIILGGSTKGPSSYAAPKVYFNNGTVAQAWYQNSTAQWQTPRDMYSDQLILWCSSCHDRYYTPKDVAFIDSGDAIYAYRHRAGDVAVVWNGNTSRYETSPVTTSYGSSSGAATNVSYNCLACHVAHGTTAFMTPMVQAEPWPGEGGGAYDTLGNGTSMGEGWLEKDTSLGAGNFTDNDGDGRSNLLRLDNRGVCQRCHQKGKLTTTYQPPR